MPKRHCIKKKRHVLRIGLLRFRVPVSTVKATNPPPLLLQYRGLLLNVQSCARVGDGGFSQFEQSSGVIPGTITYALKLTPRSRVALVFLHVDSTTPR